MYTVAYVHRSKEKPIVIVTVRMEGMVKLIKKMISENGSRLMTSCFV